MTGLLTLPAKTDESIGRVKFTLPERVGIEVDKDYYVTAEEHERLKTALLAVCERMGLASGATAGSHEAMKVSFEAGSGIRVLLRAADGTYSSMRIGQSIAAPGPGDGASAGYTVGSWWAQRVPGESGPGPITLWFCLDDAPGAAVWAVMPSAPSLAAPDVGRAGAVGVSPSYARSDHAHDGGVQPMRTVSGSATLINLDAIIHVNTSGGDVSLTLPSPDKVGRNFRIKKITADTNLITLVPHDTSASGPMIEDGGSGESVDLPDSGAAARNAWFVVWDGTQWWL